MNSQSILTAIATYRASNNGDIPSLVIVDADNIECIDHATLVARSQANDYDRMCDEYLVFVVNHSIPDYYQDNFPVLIDKHTHTTIKDYLFYLLEDETRP